MPGNKGNPTHGMHRTPTWHSWRGMRKRCLCKTDQAYHNYGGRGIQIDPRWSKFTSFLEDMGLRPSLLHSLGRKDNNDGYRKDNCSWETDEQQSNNTRGNIFLEHNGQRMTIAQWGRLLNISQMTILDRLKRGKSIEQCLCTVTRYRGRNLVANKANR